MAWQPQAASTKCRLLFRLRMSTSKRSIACSGTSSSSRPKTRRRLPEQDEMVSATASCTRSHRSCHHGRIWLLSSTRCSLERDDLKLVQRPSASKHISNKISCPWPACVVLDSEAPGWTRLTLRYRPPTLSHSYGSPMFLCEGLEPNITILLDLL